ncbi:MAG: hypothetical protein V3V26_02335 [Candidatus Aenigmarchaeota archaeon]
MHRSTVIVAGKLYLYGVSEFEAGDSKIEQCSYLGDVLRDMARGLGQVDTLEGVRELEGLGGLEREGKTFKVNRDKIAEIYESNIDDHPGAERIV